MASFAAHRKTLDLTARTFSILPSTLSVGEVTSLTGFVLNGATPLGVRNDTAYGTTTKTFGMRDYYVAGEPFTEALFETAETGRDQIVTTWARNGVIYLRLNRGSNRAIKISWSGNGSGEIRADYAVNVPNKFPQFIPQENIGGTILFQTTDISSLVTGWDANDTAGDEYEFSLIGPVLTMKWNDQTIYTADDIWFCCHQGSVLYGPTISEGAVRDTVITFPITAPTYTDYDKRVLDFRDWGWKDLQTTGSMSSASTTLTVASAAGFAIGDRICVATGGEAGAGAKQTVGVGGTWPATRVANVAALPDAETYRAANGGGDSFIWVQDVESVYINYVDGGATWGEWTDYVLADDVRARGFFHTTKLLPRALKATITDISGNTITLDTASEVATTNAEVYYDCSEIITDILGTRFTDASRGLREALGHEGWTVRFQPGTFCVTGSQAVPIMDCMRFKGAGRTQTLFYSPMGTEQVAFSFRGNDATISDFKVKGWAGTSGFCYNNINTYPTGNYAVHCGFPYADNVIIERIDFENCWGGALLQNKYNSYIRDCTGSHTNGGLQYYASWYFITGYGTNTWIEDVTFTSPVVQTGLEIFQSNGGGMRRVTSTQGLLSSNYSGGGFTFEDCVVDIDYTARPTELDWMNSGNPAININVNIGGGAENPTLNETGGSIVNPTITMVKDETGNMGAGIAVSAECVLITIEGTHPAKPGVGVITMSDYESGDDGKGATGILSDAPTTTIRGIRVIGAAEGAGFANLNTRDVTGVIEDCVADDITQWNGSSHASVIGTNGNITNATYEAL